MKISKKKIFFYILTAAFFIACSAYAITREAAVQFALENSESIRIVRENAAMLRAEARQTCAFAKPQLRMESRYLEMGDSSESNPLFESPERELSAGLTASQVLYAGGRIRRSFALGDNLEKQADLLYRSGKRDISKAVKISFDSVLLEQAVLDILKDRMKQRQNELDDAKDLREAGMVTSLDVRQAMLNLNFAKDEYKAGENAFRHALTDFNLSLGRSPENAPLHPDGKLAEISDTHRILLQLKKAYAGDRFLDIASGKKEQEAAVLAYEIARGERLPRLLLLASGNTQGEYPDETDEYWNIGLQMDWSISDGGLTAAKSASALSRQRIAQDNLKKIRKELAGSIEKIGNTIRTLEERTRLQKEAVELSRQNYDDARGQYRAGTITLTRLGDFNLNYAEARFILQRLFYAQREVMNSAEALLEEIP